MKKNKIPSLKLLDLYMGKRIKIFKMFNFDIDLIYNKAKEYKDIYDYTHWCNDYMHNILIKLNSDIISEFNKNIKSINNILQCIWIESYQKHFSVDLDMDDDGNLLIPDFISKYNITDFITNIEDCMINIRINNNYYNYVLAVSSLMYKFNYGNYKNQDAITFSIYDSKIAKPLCNITILKDLYPNKVFIDKERTPIICDKCNYCINSNIEVYEHSNNYHSERNMCTIHKKRSDWGYCPHMENDIYQLITIAAYTWDMYINRKTVVRKNSKRRKGYEKSQVSAIINNDDYKLIPVHDIYKYERAERKEHQGGHHSSPVEHDRKPHMRRIFNSDGTIKKIVPVRGSRVNKGGKKAIYVIKSNN